jgi:hypothetical protein
VEIRLFETVQIGPDSQPAPYKMGTVSLSWGKIGRNVALATHTTYSFEVI